MDKKYYWQVKRNYFIEKFYQQGLSIRQISRLTGVSRKVVENNINHSININFSTFFQEYLHPTILDIRDKFGGFYAKSRKGEIRCFLPYISNYDWFAVFPK